jgi:Flp pilus assembly protein TadD
MRRIWRFLTQISSFAVVAALAAAVHPQSELSNNPKSAPSILQTSKVNQRPTGKLVSTAQLETYKKLLGDAADDPILLNNLGVRYAHAKRFSEAAGLIEKAVALAPKTAPILVNLAVIDINLGNFESAAELFERVIAVDPASERVNAMLCDTYTNALQHSKAVKCFEKRPKTSKMDPVSTANFSLSLMELGETKRATRMLKEANAASPNNPGIMNGLGIALYKMKHYSESAGVFSRLVQLTPDHPQFRFNLAVSQMAASNRTAAIEQYNILKRSDPDLARSVYTMLVQDKLVNVGNK